MTYKPLPFKTELKTFPPKDLLTQPQLRSNLNAFVNDVYARHEVNNSEFPDAPKFTGVRISEENQLVGELGEYGLISIIFDINAGEHENSKDDDPQLALNGSTPGTIVATASVKPWKGRWVHNYLKSLEAASNSEGSESSIPSKNDACTLTDASTLSKAAEISDWEIAVCASRKDPKYRGTGCVTKCIEAILQALVRRRNILKEEDRKPIRFWLTVSHGIGNIEYWTRRGYVAEGDDTAPAGMWGSTREFEVTTMSKIVA